MQFQFKMTIGKTEFTFAETAASHKEFFEKAAFYSSLPVVGPNGEDDLEIVFRTPKGYSYYSIVSKKAGMEYKFGQSQQTPGALFGKGWEPLYQAENSEEETGASTGNVGFQAPQTNNVQQQNVGFAAPAPAPAPAAQKTTGVNQAMKTTGVNQTPPVAAQNTQVQQQANNVLAKFLNT